MDGPPIKVHVIAITLNVSYIIDSVRRHWALHVAVVFTLVLFSTCNYNTISLIIIFRMQFDVCPSINAMQNSLSCSRNPTHFRHKCEAEFLMHTHMHARKLLLRTHFD